MKVLFLHRSGFLTALAVLMAFGLSSANGFQKRGGRDPGATDPATTPTPRIPKGTTSSSIPRSGGKNPAPARTTQLTINIPHGCRIWLNEVPVETSITRELVVSIDGHRVKTSERVAGVITLNGIRPGTYRLVARKPDFREYATPVSVTLDTDNVVTVTLTPTPGKLTVSPSVGGAEIEIVSLATNISVGRYPDRLDHVELAPGQYRIVTSKAGYRVASREISLRPGESVYLEPLLEPLPRPTPAPTPAPPVTPMSFNVQPRTSTCSFTCKDPQAIPRRRSVPSRFH